MRADLAGKINHALRREVKRYLSLELEDGVAVPQWVVERVHEFSAGWYPFVGASASVVPLVPWDADEVPGRVQEFYRVLEDDLRVLGGLKKESVAEEGVVDDAKDEVETATWIVEVMEKVERCLAILFYDRWVFWFVVFGHFIMLVDPLQVVHATGL